MSTVQELDFAAFLGVDWADREHAWAMHIAGGAARETGKLPHTPEAIEAWAMQLAERFQGRPVAVAIEQSRGALIYALSRFSHLVLYPVHPSTSYDYRKAMYPSGCKDDPKDADLLLDILSLHRDRLRALEPDTEPTRLLQVLVEKRRQLVDDRTAHTNRATEQLKLYFPQALSWFDELATPICRDFLERWPTLAQLQAEDPEQVRRFFYQHGSRSTARIESRLGQMREAKPLTQDAAVIACGVTLVRTMLAVAAALNQGIAELEQTIEAVTSTHPDYFIFESFPGAGAVLAPRLLSAFGSRRDRFTNVQQILSFSGIAPVMEASGKQRWTHCRWACPKFLRQTFHEYAGSSILHCPWAREFYDRQRAKGKGHHAAVRALAFKWIRILFRCWHSRQAYDESKYLAARAARACVLPAPSNAPAIRTPPSSTGGKRKDSQWKSAAQILKSLIREA